MTSRPFRADRRSALALACAAAASALPTGFARAAPEAYPSRAITLYVAFGPGGAGDIVARAVSREMTRSMRQPVVVDNRPAPLVAETLVSKAKADGYSMVVSGNGSAVSAALFKSPPYDVMKDLVHVSTMAYLELALVTPADSPLKTVADVVAYSKAHPGKLNIGSQHVGSTQNLTAELLRSTAGIDAVIIPYRTAADLVTALRTHDVQIAIEIISPLLPQFTAGILKPIAITSTQRFPGLPHVPTVAESIPGFDATGWVGISMAAATPPAIVGYVNQQVRQAVATPSVQKALRDSGMLAQSSTPEEITQRMRDDIVKWRAVIDKAGIERQ